MSIGRIEPELEQFIGTYKKLGYTTKTELVNDAFRLLKQCKAAELRKRWREEASKERRAAKSGRVWGSVDNEDFK